MSENISSRRKFMKLLALMLPISLFSAVKLQAVKGEKPMKKIDGSFRHHVYFWLKNPDSSDERKMFLNNLTSFLTQVDEIISVHVGEPALTPRDVVDNSYQYDLLVTFKDKDDQNKYQDHPAHKKFVEDTAHLWSKVQVYDSLSIWPE